MKVYTEVLKARWDTHFAKRLLLVLILWTSSMSPLLARNTSPASYTTQQHMYRYNFICGRRVLEELKHARVQYLHIQHTPLYHTDVWY